MKPFFSIIIQIGHKLFTVFVVHTIMTQRIRTAIKKGVMLSVSMALACLLLAQATLAANAVSPESFVPLGSNNDLYPVLYDNTNGLPTAEANDIAQTSEGFIWIACYAGLIRYDGNTFERLDSTEGLNSISCLLVDRKDRLWIGTNDNGVALMEKGEVRFWNEEDGLGSPKIREIAEDGDGCIYVGTTSGIVMFDPDLNMTPLTDSRIANAYVDRMVPGDDELVYCTTSGNEMFILRDGNLVNIYENSDSVIENITAIYPDPKVPGKVYYGTEKSGIYLVDIKAGPESAEHIDIDPLYSVNEMKQIGDRLWICSRGGVGMVDEKGFHAMKELPLNNSIETMLEDYEGNLWFTSSRQGVMKLVTNRFSDIFLEYNIPETVVNSTCLFEGNMYIGSDTGLTVINEKGIVDSIPVTSAQMASGEPFEGTDLIEILSDSRIRSIIRDSRDRLWISSWQNLGLLCYDHGALTIFNKENGLLSDRVRAVYERQDGSMMVAITGGLNIIKDGRVTGTYDESSGIINTETLTVCEAPNGDMLLGSNGDGIYVLNDEGIRIIDRKDGMTSGVVMRIKYDEENKVFWLVTGNSLAYMTEDYELTTIHNFPYPDNFDIFKNSNGFMWILSSDGIYIVPDDELLANEEINPIHYGMANGLPCIATSNSYNEVTKDGDLYIAGRSGVAKVNIEEPLEEVNDLKMAVPYVEVNDKPVFPDDKGNFVIPHSAKKLAICGFVYNYSLNDPTISFMLKGFDKEFMTTRRSDFGPIYYTNLPGGKYTFLMELKDAMGKDSKELSVRITKQKAFYEQTAFIIGALVSAAIAFLLIVQHIVRRKLKAVEKRHREEREREQVTRELHMANRIQTSVLPHEFPPFPDRREFDLFASMDPALDVGGDFYDFFFTDEDHLWLVIADVSGKGIPAALMMMNTKVLLKSFSHTSDSPAEVLAMANREICESNQTDMFVTVWMAILDIPSGKLTAANAGHEYPVLGNSATGFELIRDKHGLVIGGMEGVTYQDYEIQLEPGDKIFVYTDGVPEATDANKKMFGTDRMLDALNKDKDADPEIMLENVYKAIGDFVGTAEKFDDLTMLGFEYHGPVK